MMDPNLRTRIAFTLLFALALGLSAYVMWPFRGPLFLAMVLASVLQGPYRALTRLMRGHKLLAAASTALALLVLLIGPLAAVLAMTATHVL